MFFYELGADEFNPKSEVCGKIKASRYRDRAVYGDPRSKCHVRSLISL